MWALNVLSLNVRHDCYGYEINWQWYVSHYCARIGWLFQDEAGDARWLDAVLMAEVRALYPWSVHAEGGRGTEWEKRARKRLESPLQKRCPQSVIVPISHPHRKIRALWWFGTSYLSNLSFFCFQWSVIDWCCYEWGFLLSVNLCLLFLCWIFVECSCLWTDTATLQICSGCRRLMLYVVYLSSCTPINTCRTFPLTTMCTFVFFKIIIHTGFVWLSILLRSDTYRPIFSTPTINLVSYCCILERAPP